MATTQKAIWFQTSKEQLDALLLTTTLSTTPGARCRNISDATKNGLGR
jgi:hypothetical protein